jgi:hypothetical protein
MLLFLLAYEKDWLPRKEFIFAYILILSFLLVQNLDIYFFLQSYTKSEQPINGRGQLRRHHRR